MQEIPQGLRQSRMSIQVTPLTVCSMRPWTTSTNSGVRDTNFHFYIFVVGDLSHDLEHLRLSSRGPASDVPAINNIPSLMSSGMSASPPV